MSKQLLFWREMLNILNPTCEGDVVLPVRRQLFDLDKIVRHRSYVSSIGNELIGKDHLCNVIVEASNLNVIKVFNYPSITAN